MPALRIGCIGEAMIELSTMNDIKNPQLGFAGDVLNTAIYLRRNLPEHHMVSFVSVIGQDTFSQAMKAFIAREGIDTQSMEETAARVPGLYAITVDEKGERSFTYWRDNSAARLLFNTNGGNDFSGLEQFDVLYLSAITLAILPLETRNALHAFLSTFREKGGLLAFDSNYRPRLWQGVEEARQCVSKFWKICDIALPSLDDEMALFGDLDEEAAFARLRRYGVSNGALKRGAAGPRAFDGSNMQDIDFPPAENVIDTTAAGDSFNGAFLASLLQKKPLREAMLAGHQCASLVVQHRGAILPRS